MVVHGWPIADGRCSRHALGFSNSGSLINETTGLNRERLSNWREEENRHWAIG